MSFTSLNDEANVTRRERLYKKTSECCRDPVEKSSLSRGGITLQCGIDFRAAFKAFKLFR